MDSEGDTTDAVTSNSLIIPGDAQPGDYFVVICRAKDQADAPMTRYAEFVIEVQ